MGSVGNKIIFETFIKVTNSDDFIEYKGEELHKINNIVLESVMKAHLVEEYLALKLK